MADGDYERTGPRQAELARFRRLLAAARSAVRAPDGADGRTPSRATPMTDEPTECTEVA